ncbi:response regulator [Parasphingorhabdus sp.]|uniref:response regulator n=1 Tax=Parasphingorhabdus sp. TaxID=2709688 RepID=UPI003D267543
MKRFILLVDDHELTRAGCRLLVTRLDDFEISAELDVGAGVIQQVSKNRPDLMILDVRLPDMNGLSLLAELVDVHQMPVLILTGQDDPREFAFALRMGARGVVRKNDPSSIIIDAIQAIDRGETYVSGSVSNMLAEMDEPKVELSPRQAAILHYLSVGETNKEIAYKLKIAMPTVSFHIAEMRRKLGVDSNKLILNAAKGAGLL